MLYNTKSSRGASCRPRRPFWKIRSHRSLQDGYWSFTSAKRTVSHQHQTTYQVCDLVLTSSPHTCDGMGFVFHINIKYFTDLWFHFTINIRQPTLKSIYLYHKHRRTYLGRDFIFVKPIKMPGHFCRASKDREIAGLETLPLAADLKVDMGRCTEPAQEKSCMTKSAALNTFLQKSLSWVQNIRPADRLRPSK